VKSFNRDHVLPNPSHFEFWKSHAILSLLIICLLAYVITDLDLNNAIDTKLKNIPFIQTLATII